MKFFYFLFFCLVVVVAEETERFCACAHRIDVIKGKPFYIECGVEIPSSNGTYVTDDGRCFELEYPCYEVGCSNEEKHIARYLAEMLNDVDKDNEKGTVSWLINQVKLFAIFTGSDEYYNKYVKIENEKYEKEHKCIQFDIQFVKCPYEQFEDSQKWFRDLMKNLFDADLVTDKWTSEEQKISKAKEEFTGIDIFEKINSIKLEEHTARFKRNQQQFADELYKIRH